MKGMLDTIRGRTRSPPVSNSRRLASQDADQEAALQAAMAASLAESGGGAGYRAASPASAAAAAAAAAGGPAAASAAVAAYPRGDEAESAAIAAAIAASLDLQELEETSARQSGSGGHSGRGNNSQGKHRSSSSSGSSRRGGGGNRKRSPGQPPVDLTFTGSNESQDLAFLTDAPLLPRDSGDGGCSVLEAGGRGQSIWNASAKDQEEGEGGGWIGAKSERSKVRGRRATAGGWSGGGAMAPPQPPSYEDEALARRLQEQWLSEDSSARQGEGVGVGGSAEWPIANVPVHAPSAPGLRICAGCMLPITDAVFREGAMGSFHVGCVPRQDPPVVLPPCRVCHEMLPSEGGRIHFYRHNFFQHVYCPWHHDSAPRCCSCMRLEPMPLPARGGRRRGGGREEVEVEGPFAELSDGRMLCMSCAQTAVVDSSEGAPAFQEVCRFFEQELNLHVPKEMREVPVLVVDLPTLNEQTHLDLKHGGGAEQGMPTTRGLTLSEVATVMHMAPGALHFNSEQRRFEIGRRTQVNLGEQRVVTAILVLCGLPYASFSSVLAHEATHAWMKLDPSFPSHLPPQVEEGICQLVALLWLHHLAGRSTADEGAGREERGGRRSDDGSPPSNDQLREFFAHQIKTDVSTVYGDGFRKAKQAYDLLGLHMLLDHVKRYESFPTI